ncbi:RHS repeat domain-containing protein [Paludibaculum fermentans]|uniref:RHS repeat-associated core domain-containing protein n=1 Tax=Paludibaculum fermentans TaxID=1473598 RepID=A0A7S7SN68_PALFE|nr:RHS repeat-associated core domain-containing protein [Paludibaculum fermentans]QOY90653.1 RHS repeat-associated core domain-containing protein [Paludibaculum fermentans]
MPEKIFKYSYLPAGLSSTTYPSGRVVSWSYDIAGRPDTVLDGAGGTAFATAVKYDMMGGLSKLSLGSGLEENWTYSSTRGQVRQVTLGMPASPNSVGSWQYSYCAGKSYADECATNNGNVMSQTIGPLGAVQTYTYDGMNRLKRFSETETFQQTYVYDQYGNRALLTGSTMPPWPSGAEVTNDQPSDVATIFPSNQWSQSTVVNGYVTKPKSDAYPTLSYDAEGRVATAVTGATGSANASYGYDGEGRRVQRTSSGVTTYYVYDAAGQLAAEYGSSVAASGRQYLTVDALGSTRVVTDQNKTVVPGQRHDYMPFGGSLLSTQNGRTTTLGYGVDEALASLSTLFTGKERDAETGLDFFEARYFSSAQGRFTSPDPLTWQVWQYGSDDDRAKFQEFISDPQNFNLYAYVRNNPLKYTDPTGTYYCNGSDADCKKVEAAYNQAKAAAANKDLSKDERAAINKTLKFLGKPGEVNGVVVVFGAAAKGATAVTDTTKSFGSTITTITFDPKNLARVDARTLSETLIHEGTHGVDDFPLGHNPMTKAAEMQTEMNAYSNQSNVAKGLGVASPWGVWSPGISDADRQKAIQNNAQKSTRIWCQNGGNCK